MTIVLEDVTLDKIKQLPRCLLDSTGKAYIHKDVAKWVSVHD